MARRSGVRLAAVLVVAVIAAACARLGGEAFQPTHNRVLPLEPGATVGQTFAPASRELAGVDLLVATFAQPADPGGTLRAVLSDAGSGQVLAVVTVPGEQLRDNAWVPIRFHPPVAAPATAAIEVSWSSDRPIGLFVNAPPPDPEPDRLTNEPYPHGTMLLAGQPAAGDLAFRVLGLDRGGALPRVLSGLAGGAADRLTARPLFAAGWLFAVAGAAALAVVGFRRQRGAG